MTLRHLFLAEAFLPVAGPPLDVHHGHDPHVVGLF
jgi:hypothetical protein